MQFSYSTAFLVLAFAGLGLTAPTTSSGSGHLKARDVEVTIIEDAGLAAREAVPELGHSLSKRELGRIHICPNYDWQPTADIACGNVLFPSRNFCWGLAPQLASSLSAIGPDPGTWCMLYTEPSCTGGGSDAFSYPGMARLDGYWSTWNDNTKSIKCWWE